MSILILQFRLPLRKKVGVKYINIQIQLCIYGKAAAEFAEHSERNQKSKMKSYR